MCDCLVHVYMCAGHLSAACFARPDFGCVPVLVPPDTHSIEDHHL